MIATSFAEEFETDPPIESLNGKPAIKLPGEGHLISYFAEELAETIQGQGIFARRGAAFILDREGQKLEPASPSWLRTWTENHVVPYRTRSSSDGRELRICRTMPEDTARAVLASPQFLDRLPAVERFHPVPMPWLRRDGRVELLPEGLDRDSETYTAAPGFEIEAFPLSVSRVAIDSLLEEFAWPDDAGRSKSVAIAAMLTVFAGGILPPKALRPIFLYLANAEGSGKTTLAQLAGIAYSDTPAEAAPTDEAEMQKRLLALVLSGRRVALFDNVRGHLNSPSLENYLTTSRFRGRILGVSKDFEGEAGATILVTGNGLTLTPDMRRRALIVELFMRELRAEDRTFRRRLTPATISQLRPEILSALWGLVRAWDDAGRPPASRSNSHCPEWCDTIAGIVEFSGWGCPVAPADIAGMGDTDTADFAGLAARMEPGHRYTFAELAALAESAGLFERLTGDRGEDGDMSRKAKKTLSGIFKRFDGRRVTASTTFRLAGVGKSRRYLSKTEKRA